MKIEHFILRDETLDDISDDWLWERIRIWRNNQLKLSDWTQVLDSPVNKEEWAEYRQALRDLPLSSSNPREIVFPSIPE